MKKARALVVIQTALLVMRFAGIPLPWIVVFSPFVGLILLASEG